MAIGPVQIIAFAFDRTDLFRGEILTELGRLRRHGMIRVVDLFFAKKDAAGELMTAEMSQLSAEEKKEFGHIVRGLVGLGAGGAVEPDSDGSGPELLESAGPSVGLSAEDLHQLVADLPPDKAIGILMFEHTWAVPLRDAITRAGGMAVAQGFVTPQALVMVGAELRAMAEMAETIEAAENVKTMALLEALVAVEEAEEMIAIADEVKTAIAADVLRTLMLADFIEQAAVDEALEVLATADLIEAEALARAESAAALASPAGSSTTNGHAS